MFIQSEMYTGPKLLFIHRKCTIRVDVVGHAALVTKLTARWIHM